MCGPKLQAWCEVDQNRGSVVYSVLSGLDAIELIIDKQTFYKNLLFGFRKA